MDKEFIDYLTTDVKLEPTDVEAPAHEHQWIKCLLCKIHFMATPKAKVAKFKITKKAGCPSCIKAEQYKNSRELNIRKLEEKFILPSDISYLNIKNEMKIKVTNKTCNHKFTVKIGNLLTRGVICPVCNPRNKI